jgi:hypothetical protein
LFFGGAQAKRYFFANKTKNTKQKQKQKQKQNKKELKELKE